MKILVLGAGVVGTAAAYFLARDGHEVTVVERHAGAAMGTSQSNAGLVSPGDATAWASPAALKTFVKSLYTPGLGIKVKPSLDPMFLKWCWRFLFQCTSARAHANTAVKLRLALYARECINAISADTGVNYDARKRGIVYFFRSQQTLDAGAAHMGFLAERGLEIEVVNRRRLLEIEPGLAGAGEGIAGAVYSPMDQTGDSAMFVKGLTTFCAERLAVTYAFGTEVTGFDIDGDRLKAVRTAHGTMAADAVVIALGPESGLFGGKLGIDLPVYPVKGYTATVQLADPSLGPTMGGVDDDRLIAYSRLGDRIRFASTAEFAGFDRSHKPSDFTNLFRTAHDLFPGAIDEKHAELWAGLRPMMPNSVPVHGRARYANLYLDTGHGHVGWTMACGSGKFLADLVAGRKPDIDPAGLVYNNGA
jgi:D-amino-acid dehydrogenase